MTPRAEHKKNKNYFKKLLTTFKNYAIIKYRKNKKTKGYSKSTKVVKMTLQDLVKEVKEKKYKVSNDKIKQTERNGLKRDWVDAIAEKLGEDIQIVGMSKKGAIVAIENDTEGAIYATIDVVLKNLDYDPQEDMEDYNIALEKRLEREAKRKANAKG